MPLVPAEAPAPTPELEALTPINGERPMDALARVGDGIVQEFGGGDDKDARKNKKLPRQLAALVALRAQGYDNHEIADKLRVTPRKLKALIAKARKEYGWSDLADQLAHVAIPLAMESTIKHLEHEASAAGVAEGRSTVTRATLAGVGVFKSHSAAKVESKSEETKILRVEIALPELPPGDQGLCAAGGNVLATPRRALLPAATTPAASFSAPVVEGEVVPS